MRDKSEIKLQAPLVDALAAEPARRDLLWRLGLDDEVADRSRRTTEIRNFIERLVGPVRQQRGRG